MELNVHPKPREPLTDVCCNLGICVRECVCVCVFSLNNCAHSRTSTRCCICYMIYCMFQQLQYDRTHSRARISCTTGRFFLLPRSKTHKHTEIERERQKNVGRVWEFRDNYYTGSRGHVTQPPHTNRCCVKRMCATFDCKLTTDGDRRTIGCLNRVRSVAVATIRYANMCVCSVAFAANVWEKHRRMWGEA